MQVLPYAALAALRVDAVALCRIAVQTELEAVRSGAQCAAAQAFQAAKLRKQFTDQVYMDMGPDASDEEMQRAVSSSADALREFCEARAAFRAASDSSQRRSGQLSRMLELASALEAESTTPGSSGSTPPPPAASQPKPECRYARILAALGQPRRAEDVVRELCKEAPSHLADFRRHAECRALLNAFDTLCSRGECVLVTPPADIVLEKGRSGIVLVHRRWYALAGAVLPTGFSVEVRKQRTTQPPDAALRATTAAAAACIGMTLGWVEVPSSQASDEERQQLLWIQSPGDTERMVIQLQFFCCGLGLDMNWAKTKARWPGSEGLTPNGDPF